MDYINYFNSLSSSKDRLSEKECARFKRILTNKQEQIKRSEVNTLKALIAAFGKVYWDFDTAIDDQLLHSILLHLKKKKQIALIPKLIELSYSYPKYIFWAKEMLDTLSKEEQRKIELPVIYWTSDTDYTLAGNEEIAYRKRKELPCIDERSRPCQLEDLVCFKTWLDMAVATESPCLFFNG